jgi:PilZ domain
MPKVALDRRRDRRYELRLSLHYRVSVKGEAVRAGSGTTQDMSAMGLSFRCRKPLPVGAHIEVMIDWPAKQPEVESMALLLTGFILRSDGNRTAVRVTSRRFKVTPLEAARVSA